MNEFYIANDFNMSGYGSYDIIPFVYNLILKRILIDHEGLMLAISQRYYCHIIVMYNAIDSLLEMKAIQKVIINKEMTEKIKKMQVLL